MMNFNSLFNNYRASGSTEKPSVWELLNTDASLDRLLDQDSAVNDLKSNQMKATEYFKYPKAKELLDFIVRPGPPDNKRLSYKFPFVACQLLCTENYSLIDYFFPSKQLTVSVTVSKEEIITDLQEVDDEETKDVTEVPVPTVIIKQTLQVIDQPLKEEQIPQPLPQSFPEPTTLEEHKESSLVDIKMESDESEKEEKKKKTKTRQKKIIVNSVEERPVQPLIQNLMSYFDNEVNYTLAGYVSKVLNSFCVKKPQQVIKYLLQPEMVDRMMKHIESRSIGQLFLRLLTHETRDYIPQRIELLLKLQKELTVEREVHIMANISACLVELIERIMLNQKNVALKISQFMDIFQSFNIEKLIHSIMSESDNVSAYSAPVLYAYLSNAVLSNLKEDQIAPYTQLMEQFVDKMIERFKVSEGPKLGIGKAKIVQIIRLLLKDDHLKSREIVSRKPLFFPALISMLQQYPMNNLLHNDIFKIFDLAVKETTNDAFTAALFCGDTLANFIVSQIRNDQGLKPAKNIRGRKGYIGHVFQFSQCLKEMSTAADVNFHVKEFTQRKDFIEISEGFIENMQSLNKINLAGYALKREPKCQVFFSRDDVLTAYATFLGKCPETVFEVPAVVDKKESQVVQSVTEHKHRQMLVDQFNEDEENRECDKLFREKNYIDFNLESVLDEIQQK